MSAHFRAVALVRELRSLLGPALRAARSLPLRLADQRRETTRERHIQTNGRVFRDAALDAAKTLRSA